MQIRQFRVVLKAKNFDRTCNFYGEVLALPRLQSWDDEEGRGALFQAGTGAVEVIGRPRDSHGWDEDFDYSGPQHKLVLSWIVPSAERTYEELLFRDKNVPGGLRKAPDGALTFETHDPDGVRILLREEGR
ncbi:MAG TPA: VOC family protein [Thermoanaerobaculia bacterium]|jgi:catechol 2,3-dioxygenase-like lactoylglutathione lyase family enzyme|nr:VOC family protein [Thermoanaerobaculia bacterium]